MKIVYTKKGKKIVRRNIEKFVVELDNGMEIEMFVCGDGGLKLRSLDKKQRQLSFMPQFPWFTMVKCVPELKEEE